jgi:hypothetical protein
VPAIVFGGLTMLGILSAGEYGVPGPPDLSPLQVSFYRAGHAHAGVLVILSLVIQLALDNAALSRGLVWLCRIAAPAAAILVSGGFFGVAHVEGLRVLLYAGGLLVAFATITAGVGLLRAPVRSGA